MDIEHLTAELNAIFSDSPEEIKAHLAYLESSLESCKRGYAYTEKRVRARIKRGIAKQLIKKSEAWHLRFNARRIAELKLLTRAIKEGMAYRSIA